MVEVVFIFVEVVFIFLILLFYAGLTFWVRLSLILGQTGLPFYLESSLFFVSIFGLGYLHFVTAPNHNDLGCHAKKTLSKFQNGWAGKILHKVLVYYLCFQNSL